MSVARAPASYGSWTVPREVDHDELLERLQGYDAWARGAVAGVQEAS